MAARDYVAISSNVRSQGPSQVGVTGIWYRYYVPGLIGTPWYETTVAMTNRHIDLVLSFFGTLVQTQATLAVFWYSW